MSGPPTTSAGPRNSVSRGIAGKNQRLQPLTYQSHMDAMIVTPEELSALAQSLNSLRTEIDIGRNLVGQADDMVKIFKEFGWSGSSYVKTINGKDYVVFKGHAGLRNVFKGTKYLADNADVVSYGLGKLSLIHI